jgi:hypothetical protein
MLRTHRAEIEEAAHEAGMRGGQSQVDRERINERVKSVESTLASMVRDGLLDEAQISAYRRQAQVEALLDSLPAREPAPQQQPVIDPDMQLADILVRASGLTPNDPEYDKLLNHRSKAAWYRAFEEAKAEKAARIARQQARQQAQAAPSVPPAPAKPPVTGATAVETTGGGQPVADITGLRKQLQQAVSRGNIAEAERIGDAIDRMLSITR